MYTRILATTAYSLHGGQLRKFSGMPYFIHLYRVAEATKAYDFSKYNDIISLDELVAISYGHDLYEDTVATYDLIKIKANAKIADGILSLTSRSKQLKSTEPRAKRKQIDHQYLSIQPGYIKIIKMFDRLDNLKDWDKADPFLQKYIQESYDLLDCIRDADENLATQIIELMESYGQKFV